jgi:catechol 2,3-dioxygenase-like lactoylglutathione lyase family enzyme
VTAPRVHHSAVVCSDLELSLRFYRDGLGMDVLMDQDFEGDWPTLFGGRSKRLHSVFLGSKDDAQSGIVELVAFDRDVEPAPDDRPPAYGFFLLSFYVDVDATLERLAAFGVQAEGRIEQASPRGQVVMATVRDPDGVLVELIGVPGGPA